jgi:hypothetical protein
MPIGIEGLFSSHPAGNAFPARGVRRFPFTPKRTHET